MRKTFAFTFILQNKILETINGYKDDDLMPPIYSIQSYVFKRQIEKIYFLQKRTTPNIQSIFLFQKES